jgi:hypothetical protein
MRTRGDEKLKIWTNDVDQSIKSTNHVDPNFHNDHPRDRCIFFSIFWNKESYINPWAYEFGEDDPVLPSEKEEITGNVHIHEN